MVFDEPLQSQCSLEDNVSDLVKMDDADIVGMFSSAQRSGRSLTTRVICFRFWWRSRPVNHCSGEVERAPVCYRGCNGCVHDYRKD